MSLPASALSAPIASANQLSKFYGTGEAEVRALDGVDVAFSAGSFTAIMGRPARASRR